MHARQTEPQMESQGDLGSGTPAPPHLLTLGSPLHLNESFLIKGHDKNTRPRCVFSPERKACDLTLLKPGGFSRLQQAREEVVSDPLAGHTACPLLHPVCTKSSLPGGQGNSAWPHLPQSSQQPRAMCQPRWVKPVGRAWHVLAPACPARRSHPQSGWVSALGALGCGPGGKDGPGVGLRGLRLHPPHRSRRNLLPCPKLGPPSLQAASKSGSVPKAVGVTAGPWAGRAESHPAPEGHQGRGQAWGRQTRWALWDPSAPPDQLRERGGCFPGRALVGKRQLHSAWGCKLLLAGLLAPSSLGAGGSRVLRNRQMLQPSPAVCRGGGAGGVGTEA